MAIITREIDSHEKDAYNRIVTHPLQSWEWGVFRESTGVVVQRFAAFENNILKSGYQVFFHTVPGTQLTVGYVPRGPLPDTHMMAELLRIGNEHNCVFIKLEPNILTTDARITSGTQPFSPRTFAAKFPRLQIAKKSLFTTNTFMLDLTKSEEDLLANMNSKTRYNVHLAQKKGVIVAEDNSNHAFETYLQLSEQTLRRQKFFSHNQDYHRQFWQQLHPAGIAHLLTATYQNDILVTWIVLLFNNVLYYPYGASSDMHRDVMASNAMVWEAIRWGKQHGAIQFDMWGALEANPDKNHPWYGFHRFKEGFGSTHVSFIGSYDYVLKSGLYPIYNVADKLRWMYLQGTSFLWSMPRLW